MHVQAKHLTRDQYAMNHPAGRIGKRLILRVADLMLRNGAVPVVAPGALMPDVLVQLSAKGCGCVLVADSEGSLLGIFTDGDLRRALQSVRARARCRRTRPFPCPSLLRLFLRSFTRSFIPCACSVGVPSCSWRCATA